jgi:hypothetical protein
MAYTVTTLSGSTDKFKDANKREGFFEVTLTGTYPTGGEPLVAKDFGMRQILFIAGCSTEAVGQTSAWQVYWDRANKKMKLFGLAVAATGQTEHGNIAYATASVAHVMVVGD